ncbi:hypothetical protein [Chitinivibrio alkaliphilus]|uniref:Uncharacterized protein n=1 Tax=Chitinivibrio alkaliphilus ACht1 TaxID=1313304 RepID=U7D7F6_9BACT|nr:hypothetical protein [Chitinivibrio alkaliphilus]ERP31037.1 hypothetical protein CALK_2115 [Chitinivibrio alkaliphilus ACht1]
MRILPLLLAVCICTVSVQGRTSRQSVEGYPLFSAGALLNHESIGAVGAVQIRDFVSTEILLEGAWNREHWRGSGRVLFHGVSLFNDLISMPLIGAAGYTAHAVDTVIANESYSTTVSFPFFWGGVGLEYAVSEIAGFIRLEFGFRHGEKRFTYETRSSIGSDEYQRATATKELFPLHIGLVVTTVF